MRGGAGLAGAPSGPGGRGLSRLVSACGAARRVARKRPIGSGAGRPAPLRPGWRLGRMRQRQGYVL